MTNLRDLEDVMLVPGMVLLGLTLLVLGPIIIWHVGKIEREGVPVEAVIQQQYVETEERRNNRPEKRTHYLQFAFPLGSGGHYTASRRVSERLWERYPEGRVFPVKFLTGRPDLNSFQHGGRTTPGYMSIFLGLLLLVAAHRLYARDNHIG
ncbi:MAG: hypothetical protein AAF674_00305 [Pseudomonadota bacterium]